MSETPPVNLPRIPPRDSNAVPNRIAGYLRGHLLAVVFLVLLGVALIALLSLSNKLALLIPILIFGAFGAYPLAQEAVHRDFASTFAALNGYGYAEMSADTLEGTPSRIGHSHYIHYSIRGQFQNHTFWLFEYRYAIGKGKAKRDLTYTVLELPVQAAMPDILLKSRGEDFGVLIDLNPFDEDRHFETLFLEGDFSKRFALTVLKEYELEALQLFTPDVMHELLAQAPGFSLEVVKNHLYLYRLGGLYTLLSREERVRGFFTLAAYCIERLVPKIEAMRVATVGARRNVVES